MREYEDFDEFTIKLEQAGYKGPVDKYTFEWNWKEKQSPDYAAISFYKFLKQIKNQ